MDVLIVGSGASAVHAAGPLVERGLTVQVLDFGHRDTVYAPRIPDTSFTELRRTDPEQYVYFLGREFEGIGFSNVGPGAQLTPPRQFVTAGTEERTPVSSSNFHPLESLAFGGLGGLVAPHSPIPISRDGLSPTRIWHLTTRRWPDRSVSAETTI